MSDETCLVLWIELLFQTLVAFVSNSIPCMTTSMILAYDIGSDCKFLRYSLQGIVYFKA